MVYDVLSPDAFLRPYLDDYEALAALYHLVRSAYSARPYIDRELTDKTRALLHEHTTLYNLTPPATIHELGPQELAALKQADSPDTVKVLNLRRALAQAVDEQAASQPFLISIGEQAATLNAMFQQHPDYGWDAQQQSALRATLYQALIPLVGQQQFIAATTALMKLQRV
jgi:type I restriction enzyme R subunit